MLASNRKMPLFLAALLVGLSGWGARADAGAFQKHCADLASLTLGDGKSVVPGGDGWLFLATELSHVGAGPFWGPEVTKGPDGTTDESKDPLPAILDFAAQLKALNIELLLVPVPPRVVVYPDKLLASGATLATPATRADPHHRRFYDLLRTNGVAVLDLTGDFLAARAEDAARGPVSCQQDTHWSPRGCELAADRIYALCRNRDWLAAQTRQAFTFIEDKRVIAGDLWGLFGKTNLAKEAISLRIVKPASGGEGVEPDPNSPIVLLADSHGLVFHEGEELHARGAGLSDHLSARFGFAVDSIARRGSAATSVRTDLARKFYRDEAYRQRKRLVIWCFAAREFSESAGWRKLRITKPTP
jgi:alginate O-acetyltransferase complex protein AlgJ